MEESALWHITFPSGQTPKEGDTVVMGEWRITLHKIYDATHFKKSGNTMLRVSASRELIEEAQSA